MKQNSDCSKCSSSVLKPEVVLEELCAFCLDHIRDPVQLHCQHHFCRSCLALYREERNWQAKRCPLCRRSLELSSGHVRIEADCKGSWRLKLLLLLALLLLSLGTFFLLLIYW
ncbi:E3 ubiquitin-protein ligase rnf146 [Drosophila grimshawi]|uniref:GH20274 n=1 Tax=Drosophila grimshawi TaxID=7222 RepID=B4J5C8_DROGR|nr:E3 ubiquitin-protein ligase rnf146 [Drosophila grimshawi]EDW01770.1 GH20274 [Drosophila grimshawi]